MIKSLFLFIGTMLFAILGLVLLEWSYKWTFFTLSGGVERSMGYDPHNVKHVIWYLLSFEIPDLSLRFYAGILCVFVSLTILFVFLKHIRNLYFKQKP